MLCFSGGDIGLQLKMFGRRVLSCDSATDNRWNRKDDESCVVKITQALKLGFKDDKACLPLSR